jgi:hypothetical protein
MFKKLKKFFFGSPAAEVVVEAQYKIEPPVTDAVVVEVPKETTSTAEQIPAKKTHKPRVAKPKVEESSTKATATKKAPVAKITGAKRGPKPKTKE